VICIRKQDDPANERAISTENSSIIVTSLFVCLQNHPVKSTFTKLRLLCRSLAGNNVYYLTITEPSTDEKVMLVVHV
jgi:hypothetical protein